MKRASFEIMQREVEGGRGPHAAMHARLKSLELVDERGQAIDLRFDTRRLAEEALREHPLLKGKKYVIVEVYD